MANYKMTDDWREQLTARVDVFFDEQLGPDIVDDAFRFAPKDTGRLAESIDHVVEDHELYVTAHTPYAAAVELGHRVVNQYGDTGAWVPPQPYLRPALYNKRKYAKK